MIIPIFFVELKFISNNYRVNQTTNKNDLQESAPPSIHLETMSEIPKVDPEQTATTKNDTHSISITDRNEETIEVLYNAQYGGYRLSEKAKKISKERKTDEDDEDDRDTLLILQIFNELGDEFNGEFCTARSEKILKKYKNFYKITEYDGLEDVIIDDEKYEYVRILFHDTMTDKEKIIKMKESFPNFH